MSDGEKLRLAKTRAEIWRTVAAFAQLGIGLATLLILLFVHFL